MRFSIFTFPMEQIGWGLRQLSLSGSLGNIFAIILYLFVGLIPVLVWLILKCKGRNCKRDYLLFLLSGFLLLVLYYMINPGLIEIGVVGVGKELWGGTFYSLLVGYLVLRILKKSEEAEMKGLQKGMQLLLYSVMVVFAYFIVYEFLIHLPATIATVREANTAAVDIFGNPEEGLMVTYIFLLLQSFISALPYALNVFLLFLGTKAIKELLTDAYSDQAVSAVKKIGTYCRKTLGIVVSSVAVFNVLQLLFGKLLYQIQITANIPLFSILFVVAILVVTRFVEENQKLKQDSDLFI